MIARVHGGDVYAASRELHRDVNRLIDFSASINPLGASPQALRAIANSRAALSHYPDPDCWSLRSSLAAQWKLAPEQIVVGNGSIELIHLLPRALGIRQALIVGPTFSEYASAVEHADGRYSLLLARRREQYRPPLDRAIQLVRSKGRKRKPLDAIFFCNPNSPTGQACDSGEVLELVHAAERAAVWTLVDETFGEYCEARSILSKLSQYRRLIILRSFTKFYALPGLRIGYLAASVEVARAMKRLQPPWSVNAVAQIAAEASIRDRRHADRSLSYMEQERARFASRLSALAGVTVFPSCANFLLMELPVSCTASQVTKALRCRGLLIRDCSSVPGLNCRTVRMAVRARRENDRLVAAVQALLE